MAPIYRVKFNVSGEIAEMGSRFGFYCCKAFARSKYYLRNPVPIKYIAAKRDLNRLSLLL